MNGEHRCRCEEEMTELIVEIRGHSGGKPGEDRIPSSSKWVGSLNASELDLWVWRDRATHQDGSNTVHREVIFYAVRWNQFRVWSEHRRDTRNKWVEGAQSR